MATVHHARAVKSLNNSSGRQRFVFKTFSQRIDDVSVDVYRSLDKVKPAPSEGSSFFRDCLAEWRELNTAEDFIAFYEEMTPLVQSLPLIILHKDTIMSELLSRLHMKARLSLEPILRLVAALCRDLLDDFLLYLPKISESIVSLLESGADREPEIIEQIFTSWSYIFMNLQRYLTDKLADVLKVTAKLRYYSKEYIQGFMAESVSFLLRNASFDQLELGVRKIMGQVVKKPLAARKYGVSTLLSCVMKGTSSKLHSKADRVLKLLMSDSVINLGDNVSEGSNTVVDVLILTFQELCQIIEPKELNLMWQCLYAEISHAINNKQFERLSHLLSLLISTLQINNGRKVCGYQSMVDVVESLLQTPIVPLGITSTEDNLPEMFDKVLQLMLCTLDVLHSYDDAATISSCSSKWACVFESKSLSLLKFVGKLLEKDISILNDFSANILSTLSNLIETSQEEVVHLLYSFFEKQSISVKTLDGFPELCLLKIRDFLQKGVQQWIEEINAPRGSPSSLVHGTNFPLRWGTVSCVPFFLDAEEHSSLLTDLIDAIDRLLMVESGISEKYWQSIIGAALSSYSKMNCSKDHRFEKTTKFLDLARRYKSSQQVLSAVAEFLDSAYGAKMEAHVYHPELTKEKTLDALSIFSDNLRHPEKGLRVASLRILCHHEMLIHENSTDDQPVQKKRRTESSETSHSESQSLNVLELLHLIETIPLSVSTSRRVTLLISSVHMALSAGKINEAYVPTILNAMIGIFYNRFSYVWNPASECLSALVSHHAGTIWEKFMTSFEEIQSTSLPSTNQRDGRISICSEKSIGLFECFNLFSCPESDGTPLTTVLSLLLKSLQRVPAVVESRSRSIVPLFFKFLGYSCDKPTRVGEFCSLVCRGKEWKNSLKEWLNLLALMRNLRSFHQNEFLKDVLQHRLLDANDPEVQMKVLDCLLIWSDKFLVPYNQHLKKLISFKTFREELTTWSLSRKSNLIEEPHRAYLIPILIRILMPKVRKLKKHSSRKKESVNYRKAVLSFVAELDVDELPLFFALLLKPLQIVSEESDSASDWLWTSSRSSVECFQASDFLKYFSVDNIEELSWKKRSGFLHVIEDILGVFGELHINPFLKFLLGCVVRILCSCCRTLGAVKDNGSLIESQHVSSPTTSTEINTVKENVVQTITSLKQSKELRSLCLRIVSFVLNKYEDYDFGDDFWDLFFTSVKPLVDSFKNEGSSSEKPSSLFACFVAMSRSQKLVPLLYRERSLVPDIFEILTLSSASESILRCVLKFIENLLTVDSELDDEDNDVKRDILENLETLTSSLHGFFKSKTSTRSKLVRCPGETERRVIMLLAKYINGPSMARQFMDVLLPFVENETQNPDVFREAVQVIQRIIPVLGSEITAKILNAIAPLFVSVDRSMRLFLCDLLDTAAQIDPSIHVAAIVRDLNATSAVEMGDLDYDAILIAYGKINADLFSSIHEDQMLVILSHCVFDMSSEELMLRQNAYGALLSFVNFASDQLTDMNDNTDCRGGESIRRTIRKFLLKHLGSAMKGEDYVKKEWINLLRDMVLKLPDVENLNYLKPLCDKNDDKDFFNNIMHLQRHRRARALLRFKNLTNSCFMAERIINKVFLPLFFNMLLEVNEGKGKGEHVRNASIEAISSISGHMRWDSYFSLLMRCFNEMNLNPDKQKVLLRLICSVLDQFHFFANRGLSDDAASSGNSASDSSVVLRKCSGSAIETEIQNSLQKAVLPKIQKILSSDSDKINVNISLAALKILKLLPGDVMDSQLPTIIHRISNFLKNRLESIRSEARSALAACLAELGIEYLQFIVKVLRTTLKRGYELHVLGYTLNFILSKQLSNPVRGKLDYCLDDLLAVVETDILGDVAEEKDVDKIASKMKETRKRKSFETLELIARHITFEKRSALKVLSPVTSQLQKPLTPKVKTKLETMLSHIAAGIECNTSADQSDLFEFVLDLIEDGVKKEQSRDGNLSISGGKKTLSVKGSKIPSSNLITVFALRILHKRIKKVDKKNNRVKDILDCFVPLLGNCLNSRYEDVLSEALKCITLLLNFSLSSVEFQANKIKGALFDIAQRSVDASSPLVQSCLKLLTVLLRGTKVTLSSEELHLLIQLPVFIDLENNASFISLPLLKEVVNRKLVVPEIYDLVTRVARLMVTSQEEKVRSDCRNILSQFLLDYHLSEKRLRQHLDLLLSDLLRYEHADGRKAVLEMLRTIIVKFPKRILDDQSQTLFIYFVVSLANDKDKEVRSMSGAAIKFLVRNISPSSTQGILECAISWYLESQSQHWSVAAQVLGLLVEVVKKGFQRHISRILSRAKSICMSAVNDVAERTPENSDEPTIPLWRQAYYTLIMVEKILHEFDGLFFDQDLEEIWGAICELLMHPHIWLRDASSRLTALYFSALREARVKNKGNTVQSYFLTRPSRLFMIAVSLCCQLKDKATGDAPGDLVERNLIFALHGVHSLMGQPHKFWSTLEPKEQGYFIKAAKLLESGKGQHMLLSLTSGEVETKGDGCPQNVGHLLVSNLVKRMGKIALQKDDAQMKIVFKCFGEFCSQITEEDRLIYAHEIMLPLYKVCEGFAGKIISDDMKQVAQEIFDRLKKLLGIQTFVQIYSEIRKSLMAKREKRKREDKIMAVVNPMRNAKRKLRVAAKNRAYKKRKIMTMKFGRWM